MYCVESPESWFEDFGEGTITGGKADVKLDPDFAATVDTGKLHVFLTSHDESFHLAVTTRGADGFSVGVGVSSEAAARGVKAAAATGTFTYRVVAMRKDIVAPRLAKFVVPSVALNPPKIATPPTPKGPPRHADGPVSSH